MKYIGKYLSAEILLTRSVEYIYSSWTQKAKVWIMVFSAAFNTISVISWSSV